MRFAIIIASSALALTPAQSQDAPAESEISASVIVDDLDALLGEAVDAAEALEGKAQPIDYWAPTLTYHPLIARFSKRAPAALRSKDRAARGKLGSEFGLSPGGLRNIAAFMTAMERDQYREDRIPKLISDALALPGKTGRNALSIGLAASAIDALNSTCTPDQVDALLAGTTDRERDIWLIATNCTGSKTLTDLLSRAGKSRSAILWLSHDWDRSEPAASLAAIDQFLAPEFTRLVGADGRALIVARLAREKLSLLYDMNMVEDGIAFTDSLDPTILQAAVATRTVDIQASIDGFPYFAEAPNSIDRFPTEHAAALALAGRPQQSLDALNRIVDQGRRTQTRACLEAARDDCFKGHRDEVTIEVLALDQFLRERAVDPYALLELSATGMGSANVLTSVLLCRLSDGTAETHCKHAEDSAADTRSGRDVLSQPETQILWKQIGASLGAPFLEASERYTKQIARHGLVSGQETRDERGSVDPEPHLFAELPLPETARGRRPPIASFPKTVAALPEGFNAVRYEAVGNRAVAISLSTLFDPNGEVTAGGYWVHLSDDGGKNWQAPLYTGLAEHFPYVVPAASRLPLLAGDRLQLEVEEALIDTASITYPPVGTRTRRKRAGLYLDIPISMLTRDSDGDGLTDIAARHLLLDAVGNARPFVVGQDKNCAAPASETLARIEILKQLFKLDAEALIEPVNRPVDHLIGAWRRQGVAEARPIFVVGNAEDYRCIAIDQTMIVYRPEDRERLRRMSPDFQLFSMPAVTWNRARTRGFVQWNVGWAGGTFRLEKNGQGWKLTSISDWIT